MVAHNHHYRRPHGCQQLRRSPSSILHPPPLLFIRIGNPNPVLVPVTTRWSGRRGWDAKQDDKFLYLKVDMPGLGTEHVNLSVDHNTLVVNGEEEEDDETGRIYGTKIRLPENVFNLNEILWEMKNGLLKLTIPKVNMEEQSKEWF